MADSSSLNLERRYDFGRVLGASLKESRSKKARLVTVLSGAPSDERLPDILRELGRDELRTAGKSHELDGGSKHRSDLIESVLVAGGFGQVPAVPATIHLHDEARGWRHEVGDEIAEHHLPTK